MSASFERHQKNDAPKALANIPRKLYYKIGEVCEITGLTAHVLRYWEKEFPQLCPKKTASGHRLYREKDIQAALAIKELLYERKFTIKGARAFLQSGGSAPPTAPLALQGEWVGRMHERLTHLLDLLKRRPPL